ncbi:hypothetical protein [Sedimenticola selenatireducens]|jgi:hypothetical protein|uniref:Uncharacterized protein n=1 Tax=Sedimenticola selenatireducens TaxID=191960 RepID=A0A558DNA8_9GAMM|nr:hypothetical protein [Sedimenticola selenatireducens]TVO74897.1 hypothetical protein FHP88_10420 [Sedimenticola selenatireducens]TVT62433.1 MAG: hypothetical protein FHK78_14985 [Sedimenticola selenatireducens]
MSIRQKTNWIVWSVTASIFTTIYCLQANPEWTSTSNDVANKRIKRWQKIIQYDGKQFQMSRG